MSASPLPAAQASITQQAVDFVTTVRHENLPDEALRIGKNCIIDGIALFLAGLSEPCVRILVADALAQGGRPDAFLLGAGATKVPAPLAARVLGTAGHAHDWDDTQVSHDPRHIYGLLTHPTIPPLSAGLVIAQRLGNVSGKDFSLAFQAGFEVESKISEWMLPRHYRRGHHSSGTVGTFGACVTAAKLLNLSSTQIAHALGICASLAAGIRVNFGTMTKPLHVGRAAENGVSAALLAAQGYTADMAALDGPWGFFSVMGEGYDEAKATEGFGHTLTIVDPGVSIKPFPSGILTHQSMDAMLKLVREHELHKEDIKTIRFYAGKNILEPIRYPLARTHLEAKFSMPALLSMLVLRRQASHREFTDAFIQSSDMQAMQQRVELHNDPAIDAQGYDKIRSRIEVDTVQGHTLLQWADENYRGGPSNPLSDADLEEKFRLCTSDVLDANGQSRLMDTILHLDQLTDMSVLVEQLVVNADAPASMRTAGANGTKP